MNLKEMKIKSVLKELEEDMRYTVLPTVLTSAVVVIYAFFMMLLSPFILIFAGARCLLGHIKSVFTGRKSVNI